MALKLLKIGRDLTVQQLDDHPDSWMTSEVIWDAARIDEHHDVWFDDSGLFEPGCVVGYVGAIRVPLPAYITGIDGEDVGPAQMSVEDAQKLLSRA